ncbi:MAG: CHAT domain-containing protein, partial [Cyanobacteria bacterium J06554_3]
LTDLPVPLTEQADSLTKVTGLQLLGNLHRSIGDLAASQTALTDGLTAAQAINHPDAIASLQLSLGHTAEANRDPDSALRSYQQAATSTDPSLRLRAQLSQLALLNNTVVNNTAADSTATADALYSAIESTLTTAPLTRTTLNARLDFARQQLDHGQLATAIADNLAIAHRQAQTLNDSRATAYALGYLGELYLSQQQLTDAESALQQALAIANDLQAPDLAYQWQWQLGRLYRQQGDISQAIAQYESATKSLDSLRGNLIAIAPDLRFDFREKVEPVYREWVDLLLSEPTPAQTKSTTAQNLTKARAAIESLQLAELENYFQEPCVPVSQQIDQVIENAASPTAVLYPIILANRLEIILKLPNQPLQQYTTAISQADLETLLGQLQRDLRLPFTLNEVRAESGQLYDWLMRPLAPALERNDIDTLVFVLDGFLRSIPMATLYDGQQYLIENYSIALAPGLQLVDPQPLQRKNLSALIAGLSESRHGFSDLPFVQSEVTQLQQTLQTTTGTELLLNETFTADNLTTAINNTAYPLVHLATHGQFSSDPTDTFVLAWDKPIQVNELNRLLRQSEQNRQGAIELLILSACETAAGDKRAALGLAGVAVQAGARSTLASLWNLDDESSALFSTYFYQALQDETLSKAQALRDAQQKLLGSASAPNATYQHPRYWAPYVLLGNWL